jgi:serine/threonine-protein kinase RsbW
MWHAARMGEVRTSRTFERTVASLEEIFEFIGQFFADASIPERHLFPVQFAVEELFTNQVKYAAGGHAPILVAMCRDETALHVSVTDYGVPRFDVREAPEAAVDTPIEARRPGGLGLHLLKKMVDEIAYDYVGGTSTTTITKSLR